MRRDVKRIGKGGNAADKAKIEEFEIMEKILNWMEVQKKDVRDGDWSGKEIQVINPLMLITAKPVVYLCNLSEKDFVKRKNKWLAKIKAWIDTNHPGDVLVPYSGSFESKLIELSTGEEKNTYLDGLKQKYEVPNPVVSVLPKIIVTGYSTLQLIYCIWS